LTLVALATDALTGATDDRVAVWAGGAAPCRLAGRGLAA
jgi:hypothetical protein